MNGELKILPGYHVRIPIPIRKGYMLYIFVESTTPVEVWPWDALDLDLFLAGKNSDARSALLSSIGKKKMRDEGYGKARYVHDYWIRIVKNETRIVVIMNNGTKEAHIKYRIDPKRSDEEP